MIMYYTSEIHIEMIKTIETVYSFHLWSTTLMCQSKYNVTFHEKIIITLFFLRPLKGFYNGRKSLWHRISRTYLRKHEGISVYFYFYAVLGTSKKEEVDPVKTELKIVVAVNYWIF